MKAPKWNAAARKRVQDAIDRNHGARLKCLPGMESSDNEREAAAAIAQAAALSAELLEPLKSISKKSGEMEREAPLFFGVGDHPSLF